MVARDPEKLTESEAKNMDKELSFDEKKVLLGHNIRYYRRLHRIKTKELAEKVGVKPTIISNLEQGAQVITFQQLSAIADVIGADESLLMNFEDAYLRDEWRTITNGAEKFDDDDL